MSSSNELLNDDDGDMWDLLKWLEEDEDEWRSMKLSELSEADRGLLEAVRRNDAEGVQHARRNGAIVNFVKNGNEDDEQEDWTPLMKACECGYDEIVRILLDAGADAWWKNGCGSSAIIEAILGAHLSIAEMLLHHDEDLLEIEDGYGQTPLFSATENRNSGFVSFLLNRGANAFATDKYGKTTLMYACQVWAGLEIVRRLIAAGVAVEARDEMQCTALHHAAKSGNIETMRELVVEHNANILAVDQDGNTPFDYFPGGIKEDFLIECYGNKLTADHGRSALHAVFQAAEYCSREDYPFHPPQNNLRIWLQLGKLTLQRFRTLLSTLDTELIRIRDDSGKLPIHMACRNNAPVEVVAMLVEMDPTALQLADYSGALPIHECCCGVVNDSSVRFLVEREGGVGTLAARNQEGAMPLHVLCGSTNTSLRSVQYLIQSYPGALAVHTNTGQYPFMIAACKSSTASLMKETNSEKSFRESESEWDSDYEDSDVETDVYDVLDDLSVVYTLVRMNPDVVTPH